LAYYFKNSLKRVILFSFLLSAFFELTQLTGLFFLYPRPYRLFDVNDLLLNTLGGVCGYLVYTHFLRMLPSKSRIDARSREKSGKVGFVRRLVALAADSILISAICALLGNLTDFGAFSIYDLVFFTYYPVLALALRGGTPGKLLVKIRIERIDGGGSPQLAICMRYVMRNAFVLALRFVSPLMSHVALRPRIALLIVFFSAIAFAFVDLLLSFRRDKRLWYEMLSKTRNKSYFTGGRDLRARRDGTDEQRADRAEEAKDGSETDGA
jgi:uncharacterized RDD family membrane protein YckC